MDSEFLYSTYYWPNATFQLTTQRWRVDQKLNLWPLALRVIALPTAIPTCCHYSSS